MNDLIRVDSEQTLLLAQSLTKLRDELDVIAIRLRSLHLLVSEPEGVDEALRFQRRKLNDVMDDLTTLARRIRWVTELFEENEYDLVRQIHTQMSVPYGFRNPILERD